ncbi:nucleotidyltransferase family protein [Paenibacillus mesotrionivorans]|uniref:Nucleotidyltransferase family protein n=1 Tax=Paenibacillus mesotrionivorans TaxID=3160968 RepID=A0ACC7NVP4_9BACL
MKCMPKNHYAELTQEQELVMQLVNFRNPAIERICELKDNRTDWAAVMGHLTYNRVAGIAYDVVKMCISQVGAVFNREFRFGLYMIQEMQSIRTTVCRQVLCEVAEKLVANGLPHAFLKGSILAHSIYAPGCRVSNDIDLLVNSDDLTQCGNILKELGFIQGFFDRTRNEIRSATRKEILNYRMNYGEIVPFLKKTDEPGLNVIEIDINFSLDWVSEGTGEAVAAFLNQTEDYSLDVGQSIKSLKTEFFLAHLCVHLYKEAYVLEWVQGQRDLSLYKFTDIYGFITAPDLMIDWGQFVRIAVNYEISKECYYALEYTRLFFPVLNDDVGFIGALQLIKPDDLSYLNEIVDAANPGIRYRWEKNLLDRFFDMKRADSLIRV